MDFIYAADYSQHLVVAFFIALLSFYYIGYKQGSKHTSKPPDDEEIRKAREMRKSFMNMLTYDVDTALQKKKVM
jgi:hypothetical protein